MGEKKGRARSQSDLVFFCSTLNVFRYGVLDGSLERTVREAARYTLKSKEKKYVYYAIQLYFNHYRAWGFV